MHRPVYLQGRGLACALGESLPDSLRAWQAGQAPALQRRALGESGAAYRPIPDGADDATDDRAWLQRTLAHIEHVVHEARPDRRGALLLASSSLDIGRLERGGAWYPDGLGFPEEVARRLAWQGPVLNVATACTSAVNALRQGATLVAHGEVPAALVLGIELFSRFTLGGFAALQLLPDWPPGTPAPTGGLVLGEAVAALSIGPTPARWRLRGGAHCVSGSDPAGPTGAAIDQAIHQALAQAGWTAAQIGHVKAHATGQSGSDALEDDHLRLLLPHQPPRSRPKTLLGHSQGASAAAELALLTALPTLPGISTARPGLLALSLGFGGGHGALVLEDGEARHAA